jgi:hypothetical protein
VFNHRNLNSCEAKILAAIVEECGPAEVLRAIGQIVAHEHPDLTKGNGYRAQIARTALAIARDKA